MGQWDVSTTEEWPVGTIRLELRHFARRELRTEKQIDRHDLVRFAAGPEGFIRHAARQLVQDIEGETIPDQFLGALRLILRYWDGAEWEEKSRVYRPKTWPQARQEIADAAWSLFYRFVPDS